MILENLGFACCSAPCASSFLYSLKFYLLHMARAAEVSRADDKQSQEAFFTGSNSRRIKPRAFQAKVLANGLDVPQEFSSKFST